MFLFRVYQRKQCIRGFSSIDVSYKFMFSLLLFALYVWDCVSSYDCSEALPFFLLLVDLSKACTLAKYALSALSQVCYWWITMRKLGLVLLFISFALTAKHAAVTSSAEWRVEMPPSHLIIPKFHYTDFYRGQVLVRVADTNHLDMSRWLRQSHMRSPWQTRLCHFKGI